MHLIIARADLHRALAAVVRVVEGRNTIPILSNALLAAEGETLTVTGTDLDLVATRRVPAEVKAPGRVTVPARVLEEIARKLPDNAQLALKADPDGKSLTVTAGRSRFVLAALPADDWPDFPMPALEELALDPRALAAAIAGTRTAISTEETRYYLNGIYAHGRQGDPTRSPDLALVATDGHRLGRRLLPDLTVGISVIWPRKAVETLAAMLSRHEKTAGAVLTYGVCAQRVRFAIADEVLESKVIDGTFPDYARVIPGGNDRRATLDRRALAAALDRVTTVRSERGSAVRLEFAGSRLALSITSPDHGTASEEIDITPWQGEPLVIGLNGHYLADLLAALDADTVEVALDQPGAPTLWTVPDKPDRLMVLMPMRVS